jgi:hypothetical protein
MTEAAAAAAADDDGLGPVDREALERAVSLVLADRGDFSQHVASMLRERKWIEVAQFCAFSLQMDALSLKPWQEPPCWDGEDVRDPQTRELASRLRAANLSIFEPSPLAALARAEKPKRPQPRK